MSDIPRRVREAAAGSVVPKMLLVAGLVLLLLIPLLMIRGLVDERSRRRSEAEDEIVRQSGGEQTVAGPMLVVPFLQRSTDEKGRVEETVHRAVFLPRTLEIEGRVSPELRRRGIYEVTLYRADLRVTGSFAAADFSHWRVAQSDILWSEAALVVEVAGMHGLREQVTLEYGGAAGAFGPAKGESGLHAGAISAPLPASAARARGEGVFSFALSLRGGRSIGFLPFGEQTRVRLESSWPSPSFGGAFLPVDRSLGPGGFSADWSVLSLGRSYPQAWLSGEVEEAPLADSRFAVELLIPVDAYLKSERSVKHGVLFVLLPFVALFLYEIWTKSRIHPMQYLLIGAAECLFYLLLLSLSEHMRFDVAYLSLGIGSGPPGWRLRVRGARRLATRICRVGPARRRVRLSVCGPAVGGLLPADRSAGAVRRPGRSDAAHAAGRLVPRGPPGVAAPGGGGGRAAAAASEP